MKVEEERVTEDVLNVGGKEKLVLRVQDAEGVRLLLNRIIHRKHLIPMIHASLGKKNFGVWVWGEKGFALVDIHDSPIHGRIASLEWLESEPGYTTKKDIAPLVEAWAKEQGAIRIATLVYKEAPWEKLTGWKPIALAIGKDL